MPLQNKGGWLRLAGRKELGIHDGKKKCVGKREFLVGVSSRSEEGQTELGRRGGDWGGFRRGGEGKCAKKTVRPGGGQRSSGTGDPSASIGEYEGGNLTVNHRMTQQKTGDVTRFRCIRKGEGKMRDLGGGGKKNSRKRKESFGETRPTGVFTENEDYLLGAGGTG